MRNNIELCKMANKKSYMYNDLWEMSMFNVQCNMIAKPDT